MIKTGMFDSAHLAELKKALAVYAQRHRVVADNIANVSSDGYRAQEYRFEEYLQGAQKSLRGLRTHPEHLAIGPRDLSETAGKLRLQENDYDNGVNNVDIDQEMTSLATNDLSYRLATRMLSMKYSLLRGAITGQVR